MPRPGRDPGPSAWPPTGSPATGTSSWTTTCAAPSTRRPAARFLTEEVTVEYGWKGGTRLFARGNIYSEDRHNGTQLQTNKSELKTGALGFDWPRGAGVDPHLLAQRGVAQALRVPATAA